MKIIEVIETQFKGGNFRAWMFQIARNKMVDFFRRKRPDTLMESQDLVDDVDNLAVLIREERIRSLQDCLEQLEDPHKEVVTARMHGLSSKEISSTLGIVVATINTRFSRAKDSIAKCMEEKSL